MTHDDLVSKIDKFKENKNQLDEKHEILFNERKAELIEETDEIDRPKIEKMLSKAELQLRIESIQKQLHDIKIAVDPGDFDGCD